MQNQPNPSIPQAPPAIDFSSLAPVQRLVAAAPALTAWEAMRLLLSQRAALPRRPDEAIARAVFAVACHCEEPQAAQDAAAVLLEWCGAPMAAAGACVWGGGGCGCGAAELGACMQSGQQPTNHSTIQRTNQP